MGHISIQYGLLLIIFLSLLSPNYSAHAESLANEKLLEILEKKGFLTKEEVDSVKELITEEEQKEVKVVYDDGFRMRTKDKSFEARIGVVSRQTGGNLVQGILLIMILISAGLAYCLRVSSIAILAIDCKQNLKDQAVTGW